MRPPRTPTLALAALVLPTLLLACPGTDKVDTGDPGAEDRDADGWTTTEGDCDDGDPEVFPGATERCNGVDDDCDSVVDEDAADAGTWWTDGDGDGHGDPDAPQRGCVQPGGTVDDDLDCDDGDPSIAPGAEEHCDGVDEDCDGLVDDDAVDAPTWYADVDGDGFGVEGHTTTACTRPEGFAEVAWDCDDGDGDAWPGAPELCNGADSDCDGRVDDGGCPIDAATEAWIWTATTVGGLHVQDLAVGDIDGDGQDDLVLGQPDQADGIGLVRIARGPLDDRGLPPLTTVTVGEAGDQGGYAVTVGDVDGDGYADLLAGLPFAEDAAGNAWLFQGPIGGAPADYDARIRGVDPLDFLGQWVLQPAGDLDADGSPDVVVGAIGSGDGGAIFVISDPMGTTTSAAFAAAIIEAADSGEGVGAAATGPGDLDGDGVDDLLSGSLGTDEVQLFRGPLGPVQTTDDADWRVHGDSGSGLGSRVDVADVDGDGAVELIAGARLADDEAGALLVLPLDLRADLDAADASLVVLGPETGAALGGPDVGYDRFDVDADGAADVLLGSPEVGTGGAAWLLFGGPDRVGTGTVEELADRFLVVPHADTGHGATVAAGALDGPELGSLVVAGPDAESLIVVPSSRLLAAP